MRWKTCSAASTARPFAGAAWSCVKILWYSEIACNFNHLSIYCV